MTWMVLPGLALVPDDYSSLAAELGGDVRVLDSWQVPVTGPVAAIREHLGPSDAPITVIGHSVGGLAALEWALQFPAEVDSIILLDPTSPYAPEPTKVFELTPRIQDGSWSARLFRAMAPTGPWLRRIGVAWERHSPDDLPAARAVSRYGNPTAWKMLTDQWIESWGQATRVRELLAATALPHRPYQLVGLRGPRPFLREQWDVAARLHSWLVPIAGEGHLFPCDAAPRIASIARRARGATTPRSDRSETGAPHQP